MGRLIDGVWTDDWYDTARSGGRFVRAESAFRGSITADGVSGFKAEPGRYHLYVSLACPWAHRTLITRKLKRLENAIGVSIVDPVIGREGWTFGEEGDSTRDSVNGARRLHELYTAARPGYSGRVTVPVLWDRRNGTIVNNESAEIIRMFNAAFDHLDDRGRTTPDLCPVDLRAEIDAINAYVYERVNNGVYKAGFATTQAAYEEAFVALFDALDRLERRLSGQRYLAGERITEADWRLFTTLVRFDAVYFGHFKCNLRRIADYASLSNYLRELYQAPGIAETVDFDHIKRHYYLSHARINPSGIVPKGPALALEARHDRDRLPGHRWAA
jgi:putative glutathione S-transferase